MRTKAVLFFLFIALTPALASPSPVVLDFEALADLEIVSGQFSPTTFVNGTALRASSSLNEFEFPPASGSSVVFDSGGPMTVSFDTPVTAVGGFFTYTTRLTLEAFDAGHLSLGSVTSLFDNNLALSGELGSTPNEFLMLASLVGISSLTIRGSQFGESFVLDDLTISTNSVPEPQTLSLLLVGGLVIAGRRRMGRLAGR